MKSLRTGCHLFLVLCVALCLGGCHAAPRAITLPTTAAVRAPLVAAQTHFARAIAIGDQEAAIVKLAGSQGLSADQTHQVSALIATDQREKVAGQNQLSLALYQTGSLQKELDAKQAQFDAVARHDAAKTVEVDVLQKVLHRWKAAVVVLVAADYFAGAPIQNGLHWLVAFVWRWLLIVWRCIAIPLKAAFPLYLFWLPV